MAEEIKCEICKRRKADWERIRHKQMTTTYMCDPCLERNPKKLTVLDDYKYIGDK